MKFNMSIAEDVLNFYNLESSSHSTSVTEPLNTNIDDQHPSKNEKVHIQFCDDSGLELMLEHLKYSSAIFQSQQIGDPDLTVAEKKVIAQNLLLKNPVNFLIRFGEYLKEEHLNIFLEKYKTLYEVEYYVKNFKSMLCEKNRKTIQRNRRYEAMQRMEANSNYFSEIEMEKREPLLYNQMVGQFLTEKEKLLRNREVQNNDIPTFSKFLIDKMERDEVNELRKLQQKEEYGLEKEVESSEDDFEDEQLTKRWGESWEEEEKQLNKENKRKKIKKPKLCVSAKEKELLFQEFKSIMQNNFLNGKDNDFIYSEIDDNPDYDSIKLKSQDEEDKYFDEESNDNALCTDTGIEDY